MSSSLSLVIVFLVSSAASAQTYIRGTGQWAAKTYDSGTMLTLDASSTTTGELAGGSSGVAIEDDAQYAIASTGWFADTNGYVTTSTSPACVGVFLNTALAIDQSCTTQHFAAFWDDLVPTVDSVISFGTGGNSTWYVQWTDFATLAEPTTRITVRLTYFASPQRALFQYISASGPGSDGSSATIGGWINSSNFVQVSHNTAVPEITGTAAAGSSVFAAEVARDQDSDGLLEYEELALGTSDTLLDSDSDGVTDAGEVSAGTDPNNGADTPATTDTDGDGIVDIDEPVFGTDPTLADTDDDGIDDGDRACYHGYRPPQPRWRR